jgi:hypothetical protein
VSTTSEFDRVLNDLNFFLCSLAGKTVEEQRSIREGLIAPLSQKIDKLYERLLEEEMFE